MYDFAMCDPPWKIAMAGRKKEGSDLAFQGIAKALPYETYSPDVAFSIYTDKVQPLMVPNHTLWLWCTEKTLQEAERLSAEAGYRLHARLIWDKRNGLAPAFTVRFSHEYLLWLWAGKFQPVSAEVRGKFTTVISASRREHSRKPEEFYTMAESLWPNASRIDVFSREQRLGWTAWGNETDKFNTPTKGD